MRVIEVFARYGCNAFMSMSDDFVRQALDEVEQRVGVEMIWIATPGYPVGRTRIAGNMRWKRPKSCGQPSAFRING